MTDSPLPKIYNTPADERLAVALSATAKRKPYEGKDPETPDIGTFSVTVTASSLDMSDIPGFDDPTNILCRVMQVKRCSYYAYLRRETYRGSPLRAKIKECFNSNARRYGSRRIATALKIGRGTVRKVLQSEGLKAIQPKSFKPPTTDSKHGFGYNENLLNDVQNEPQTNGEVLDLLHK